MICQNKRTFLLVTAVCDSLCCTCVGMGQIVCLYSILQISNCRFEGKLKLMMGSGRVQSYNTIHHTHISQVRVVLLNLYKMKLKNKQLNAIYFTPKKLLNFVAFIIQNWTYSCFCSEKLKPLKYFWNGFLQLQWILFKVLSFNLVKC